MLLKWDIEAQSYGRSNVSKLRISKLDCCDAWILPQLTVTASVNKKVSNSGSTLNCTYQNQMNSNCTHQFSKKVNVICECSLMKTFVSLWILMHSWLLTRNIFIVVWPLIFMGKPKSMEELVHNGMVVKAVAVQNHYILASFFANRWFTIIFMFAVIFSDKDIVFFYLIPGS